MEIAYQPTKKIIAENIRDEFLYKLGIVEKDQEHEFGLFIFMLIGTFIAGLLLWHTDFLDEVPRETFIMLFYFFGDIMFEYLFITKRELQHEQRLAGQLASIKVIFSGTYKMHYTEEQISQLYAELDLEQ